MKYFSFNCDKYVSNKNNDNLILLHGWGMSGKAFDGYLEDLKRNHNVYVIDFYGFGQSTGPEPFFDVYEYALQLYLFLVSQNITKVKIFAHSFGARVGMILSAFFGINVTSMVITGGAGLKPKRSLIYYFRVYLYKILKKFKGKNIVFASQDYKSCSASLRPVFVRVVNQHLDYALPYILSKTLLVWGKLDKETPMYMYKKLCHSLPRVSSIVIEEGTHFCAFTHIYLCRNKIVEFFDNDK